LYPENGESHYVLKGVHSVGSERVLVPERTSSRSSANASTVRSGGRARAEASYGHNESTSGSTGSSFGLRRLGTWTSRNDTDINRLVKGGPASSQLLRRLAEQLKAKDKTIGDLAAMNKILESNLEEWKGAYDDIQQENDDLRQDIVAKGGDPNYHLDDGEVESRFKALQSTIVDISHLRYGYSAKTAGSTSSSLARQQFEYLVRDPENYLKTALPREQLIQAFIWNYLVSEVFSLSGVLWAGEGAREIESLSGT